MESIEIQNESAALRQYLEDAMPQIENALGNYLPNSSENFDQVLDDVIRRFVFADERRVSALLTLLSAEIMGESLETVLPAATAVEFIGASARAFQSVVESSLLKGDPETTPSTTTTGILAGVALLNSAYDLIFVNHSVLPERAMRAHAEIVECVGTSGIFGNAANMKSEISVDPEIRQAGDANSAALIRLSVRLGAVLSGANYLELDSLSRFAGQFSMALAAKDSLAMNRHHENFSEAVGRIRIKDAADQAKLILIEHFPSAPSRSVLIQLIDQLTGE